MNKKKLLLFDFDGVLVDSYKISYFSHQASGGKLSHKKYRQLFLGNIYQNTTKQIIFKKDFFFYYKELLKDLKPVPYADKVLNLLAKKYLLIIVSSTPENLIAQFLNKYALKKYFKTILGKNFDHSKIIKINFALKKYRMIKNNCLFITDTVGDIVEARKCGVKSVAVSQGFHSPATLRKAKPIKIAARLKSIPLIIDNYFGQS